ncbi:TIGR01440 family protein [Bacillus aquiflavi]|uniref:UPF0340 protein G4D64_05565 n=1 Tax=Bacillus aquiflavi TaxID=2672567 RepID=A0A6B3VXH7_9BACI|nr:TIGR01440 family protein [Bacillus aquiflavi]MBA4536629.1 TIGR01440 family protein [Bacillus aquiflavi]NEY80997.1 TIGR01440 family protein [Bacillus aquiflavi]
MDKKISNLEQQFAEILADFQKEANLASHHLLVIGCSTSEVIGEKIGTAGTIDVAKMIYQELKKFQKKTGVQLAFQCCEHLNRALVVERTTAKEKMLEEVSVIPARTAGGAMATHAFRHFHDPVVVEFVKADAGIDIGDTLIGMHLKHVAVPVRIKQKSLGAAHITLAKTRPKLIGGERAVYKRDSQSCSF